MLTLGKYPDNLSFNGFHIDYHKDLAQYNVPEKFIYTNHTNTQPVDESPINTNCRIWKFACGQLHWFRSLFPG